MPLMGERGRVGRGRFEMEGGGVRGRVCFAWGASKGGGGGMVFKGPSGLGGGSPGN